MLVSSPPNLSFNVRWLIGDTHTHFPSHTVLIPPLCAAWHQQKSKICILLLFSSCWKLFNEPFETCWTVVTWLCYAVLTDLFRFTWWKFCDVSAQYSKVFWKMLTYFVPVDFPFARNSMYRSYKEITPYLFSAPSVTLGLSLLLDGVEGQVAFKPGNTSASCQVTAETLVALYFQYR